MPKLPSEITECDWISHRLGDRRDEHILRTRYGDVDIVRIIARGPDKNKWSVSVRGARYVCESLDEAKASAIELLLDAERLSPPDASEETEEQSTQDRPLHEIWYNPTTNHAFVEVGGMHIDVNPDLVKDWLPTDPRDEARYQAAASERESHERASKAKRDAAIFCAIVGAVIGGGMAGILGAIIGAVCGAFIPLSGWFAGRSSGP